MMSHLKRFNPEINRNKVDGGAYCASRQQFRSMEGGIIFGEYCDLLINSVYYGLITFHFQSDGITKMKADSVPPKVQNAQAHQVNSLIFFNLGLACANLTLPYETLWQGQPLEPRLHT